MDDPCRCDRCPECVRGAVTDVDVADISRQLDEAHAALMLLIGTCGTLESASENNIGWITDLIAGQAADGERIAALLARQTELTAEVARLKLQVAELEGRTP